MRSQPWHLSVVGGGAHVCTGAWDLVHSGKGQRRISFYWCLSLLLFILFFKQSLAESKAVIPGLVGQIAPKSKLSPSPNAGAVDSSGHAQIFMWVLEIHSDLDACTVRVLTHWDTSPSQFYIFKSLIPTIKKKFQSRKRRKREAEVKKEGEREREEGHAIKVVREKWKIL